MKILYCEYCDRKWKLSDETTTNRCLACGKATRLLFSAEDRGNVKYYPVLSR